MRFAFLLLPAAVLAVVAPPVVIRPRSVNNLQHDHSTDDDSNPDLVAGQKSSWRVADDAERAGRNKIAGLAGEASSRGEGEVDWVDFKNDDDGRLKDAGRFAEGLADRFFENSPDDYVAQEDDEDGDDENDVEVAASGEGFGGNHEESAVMAAAPRGEKMPLLESSYLDNWMPDVVDEDRDYVGGYGNNRDASAAFSRRRNLDLLVGKHKKHTTPSPTTLKCYKVGKGPIPGRDPPETCQLPFTYQRGRRASAQTFDYCASVQKSPPYGAKFSVFGRGKTGLWCPTIIQGGIYQPYNREIQLQWSWCNCTGPSPPPEAVCTLRAGISSLELHEWQPKFIPGPPGAPCVFPFTYNHTTYYECADVNPKDPIAYHRFGWCFSDVSVYFCFIFSSST